MKKYKKENRNEIPPRPQVGVWKPYQITACVSIARYHYTQTMFKLTTGKAVQVSLGCTDTTPPPNWELQIESAEHSWVWQDL